MMRAHRGTKMLVTGLLIALIMGVTAGGSAQSDSIPFVVAQIALSAPVSAVSIPDDASLLLLSDTAVEIYRLGQNDPMTVSRPARLALDGSAALLAPAAGYGLTTFSSDAGSILATITPNVYNPRRGWEAIPLIDLPVAPLALASSELWAAALFDTGYVLLELLQADAMNSRAVETASTVVAAAFFGDSMIYSLAGDAALYRVAVSAGPEIDTATRLFTPAEDAQPVALAASVDGLLGAALLDDGRVIVFDPTTGSTIAAVTAPVEAETLAFALNHVGAPVIVTATSGATEIGLLDLTTPTAPVAVEILALDEAITAWAVRGNLIAVVGSTSASLYRVGGE